MSFCLVVLVMIMFVRTPIAALLALTSTVTFCLMYGVFLNALPKLLMVLFIMIYIGAVLVLFGYMGATNYETNHSQPFFNKKAFILILFIISFTYLSHINNWASFLPKDLIMNNSHSLNLLNHFLMDQSVFFFSLAIFMMLLVMLTSSLISKNTSGTFRSI